MAKSDIEVKIELTDEGMKLLAQLKSANNILMIALEKLRDGPGNKMQGWRQTWAHDFAKDKIAEAKKAMGHDASF